MSPVPVFSGEVGPRGSLSLKEPRKFRSYLSGLRGKRVDVIVRTHRERRSNEANRYYWGVVVALLAEEFGYEKEECHEVLAMHFLRIEDCPITGAPRRKRTPDCDTKEFSDYVDACIRLAAEHGVEIPPAQDVEFA